MQKLNKILSKGPDSFLKKLPSNLTPKIKKEKNRKKKPISLKKTIKRLFKKDTVVKVIIIVATASLLLPLILPFLG